MFRLFLGKCFQPFGKLAIRCYRHDADIGISGKQIQLFTVTFRNTFGKSVICRYASDQCRTERNDPSVLLLMIHSVFPFQTRSNLSTQCMQDFIGSSERIRKSRAGIGIARERCKREIQNTMPKQRPFLFVYAKNDFQNRLRHRISKYRVQTDQKTSRHFCSLALLQTSPKCYCFFARSVL